MWNDTPDRYKEVRIIFKDFETSNWTWDAVAKSYYWHRFYSHQPDLNFDNPEVQKAMLKVVDYWMEMGVDGLRLDAVPYLFERDGTSCENLPETHEFLRKLRSHVDKKFPGRMLLAEANQWPEDAVAYFGKGDECHMCFHFPVMPRLFMAIRMEDRYSIVDILKQTPDIDATCQWAMFLRNHDELTLEMVTDEERDYMYNVYASDPKAAINLGIRRRLAPLVGNDRRQIELLNGLLFSLPGTPVLYYGDEIGMGDNIHLGDRNGVRTPFQWSPDRNAGFSSADPQSLYLPVISTPEYHYETINVETAQSNPNSLLWWTKKLIAIRKACPEFSSGKLDFIESKNPKILAFVRTFGNRTSLVVANLSRTVQFAELNLAEFKDRLPVELFGQAEFPVIGEQPYMLTLGPYSFYWFSLVEDKSKANAAEDASTAASRTVRIKGAEHALSSISRRQTWEQFKRNVIDYLPKVRWFQAKEKKIVGCDLVDAIEVKDARGAFAAALLIVNVAFSDGRSENYLLPVSCAEGEESRRILKEHPELVIASFTHSTKAPPECDSGIYFDAARDSSFAQAMLLNLIKQKAALTDHGTLVNELVGKKKLKGIKSAEQAGNARRDNEDLPELNDVHPEQSNSSFFFGKEYHLKLYRKLEAGESPEIEIGRFLTETGKFKNTPALLGSTRYVNSKKSYPIAVLQKFVGSESDGWSLFLSHLSKLSEKATATLKPEYRVDIPPGGFTQAIGMAPPAELQSDANLSFTLAQTLGQRTAQMHRALSSGEDKTTFSAEPFNPFYQRSLYQSFMNHSTRELQILKKADQNLPEELRPLAKQVLELQDEIFLRFSAIKDRRIDGSRIRVHGDFHLGQVLYTGKDFTIIDFEGEPKRPIGERRLKRSPLADVAGMLRSFDYLGEYYIREKIIRTEDRKKVAPFIVNWSWWLSAEYFKSYLDAMKGSGLLPTEQAALQTVLDAYLLEKALYEVTYELGARPSWTELPLSGILRTLGKTRRAT